MSNPVKSLRKMLATDFAPKTGEVLSVSGDQISVITSRGVVQTTKTGATNYRAGDSVRLVNGVVAGIVKDSVDLPVYYV